MRNYLSVKSVVLSLIAIAFLIVIAYACIIAVLVSNQISDSSRMIQAGQSHILANIKSNKSCLGADKSSVFQGEAGLLSIHGTYTKQNGDSCPTGCQLEYKFSDEGLHKEDIHGKVILMDVLNNGQLSKNPKTTFPDSTLPPNLNVNNVQIKDKCKPMS